ncbi:hypothetical protein [Brevundimonas nasdae]|uniref:Uncharacterized protein n=1 Tax=Brevundimonas nasdae TaxID=172043 RepID=A0ACD4VJZ8_9CAUL|nr:hypothetical protein [Brevundimonas nasdae]WOB78348.1 hypothetical protein PZA08_13710 [Brevundimonas nasdae]
MVFTIALTLALATGAAGGFDTPHREIIGPKTLCFKYSSLQLVEGERVADVRVGLEGMGIEVEGPQGRYSVQESEIFARPATLGRRVNRNEGTNYYRSGNPVSYAIAGRTSYSPDRDTLVVRMSGPALAGRTTDAEIYRRVTVADPASLRCDNRYLYGWDIALGLSD